MELLRIVKVIAKPYWLEIFFDNQAAVILNMEPRLNSLRFAELKEPAVFEQAVTDGQYIRWGNQVEISVSEIFHLAQK